MRILATDNGSALAFAPLARASAWWLLGLAVGGGVGWWVFRDTDVDRVSQDVGAMDWRMLGLALGALLTASVFEALAWKRLLRAERVSTGRLFMVKAVGEGLNNLSPVRVLSDIARTTLLHYGNGVRVDKIMSSLLFGKLLGVTITCLLLGLGLLLLPQLAGLRSFALAASAAGILVIVLLVPLALHLHRIPLVSRFTIARSISHSVTAMGRDRVALLTSFLCSAMGYMAFALAAWAVARAAGIDLPFWVMSVIIVAVSVVASTVPAPPGGVGVYQFAMVSLLGLFAVEATAAMTFALVFHALVLLPPLVISAAVLVVDRRTARHVAESVRELFRDRQRPAEAA